MGEFSNNAIDIVAMQEEVRLWCEEKGWANDGRTFGDEIALLHSELSEALEAYREWGFEEGVEFPQSLVNEVGLLEAKRLMDARGTPAKPRGVPSELADVLVRLLDTCSRHGIDLGRQFRQKMDYNWTRTHRHGGKNL